MTLREGSTPTWLARILEAEAARPAPSAATKQAIAAGLAAARASHPPPRLPYLRVSRSRATAALVGAFAFGALSGGAGIALVLRPTPESHPPSTAIVSLPTRSEPPPISPSSTPIDAFPPEPPTLPLPKPKGTASTPSSRETQERTWLERARSAIARGDGPSALAAIEAHRRNHPESEFAEERDALYVQALAKSARHEDADRAATSFESRYPQSIFLGNVRACRTPRAAPSPSR